MKKKIYIGAIVFGSIVLAVVGYLVISGKFSQKPASPQEEVIVEDIIEPADPSISLILTNHPSKENTVVLTVKGLGKKYAQVAYELSYDSAGTTQGVISKPLDASGMDSFIRDDIYLGTCSKNVCRAHPDVGPITAVVELTSANGKLSQLSKEFSL